MTRFTRKIVNGSASLLAISVIASVVITGCGGGGGGGAAPGNGTLSRVHDAPVAGLNYTCTLNGQAASGVTAVDGAFNCTAGLPVTFSIGKITLGTTATSAAIVTPIDLAGAGSSVVTPAVTDIVQLLLSLDPLAAAAATLGAQPNYITLSQTVQTNAKNLLTPVTLIGGATQPQLAAYLTSIGTGATLVTQPFAKAHITKTMNGLFQGTYGGTFTGAPGGTWIMTVDALGNATGSATAAGAITPITGAMTTTITPVNTYPFAGTAGLNQWIGTLNISTGSFSGTYTGGTYAGSKTAGALPPVIPTLPTVLNFAPATGLALTNVTINGTNLTAPLSAVFGTTIATITPVVAGTSATVIVPAGLTVGVVYPIYIGGASGVVTVGNFTAQ